MTEAVETRAEVEKDGDGAKYWQLQLELSDQDHKDFIESGQAVVKRYRAEKAKASNPNTRRINILYSNTETLKSTIYARQAKPDVRRRFTDQDPIGRQVSEVIERALGYCSDSPEYGSDEDPIDQAIEDYLLPGRGVVRIDYEPEIEGEGQDRKIKDQKLIERYWFWEDFRHEPCRNWAKCTWVGFRWKMSRKDLVINFGEELGEECPLDWSPQAGTKKLPDAFKRAEVWEIWDKTRRKRYWVSKAFGKVLRTDDDPYGLQGFFNIAKPLCALTTNDTLIPEPEFHVYKDQADGLDEIENRIDRLTRALKRRGVYDETIKELEKLRNAADNQFIPVKSYAEFLQKGGLEKAFQSEDISTLAQVLKELHAQRELRIQAIYEITGISDIFRGATDPNETLGAQQLKANFGGARIKKRQDRVQKWIRNTLRIKAEIIAEHFEPAKLAAMTGLPVDSAQAQNPEQAAQAEQIIQVLRSDKLRSYRVDIETDSTVFEDAQAEKQSRVELITAMTGYLDKAVPVGQAAPELMPLLFEVLSFGLRGFKAGRTLEDIVEQTKQNLLQKAANPQPLPPDPKVEAEKIKAQTLQAQSEAKIKETEAKTQATILELKAKLEAQQQEIAMEREKGQAELAYLYQKLGIERQNMEMEQEAREREHAMAAEASEREHALSREAMDRKHEIGMEAMAEKAKQAKQPKQAGR